MAYIRIFSVFFPSITKDIKRSVINLALNFKYFAFDARFHFLWRYVGTLSISFVCSAIGTFRFV